MMSGPEDDVVDVDVPTFRLDGEDFEDWHWSTDPNTDALLAAAARIVAPALLRAIAADASVFLRGHKATGKLRLTFTALEDRIIMPFDPDDLALWAADPNCDSDTLEAEILLDWLEKQAAIVRSTISEMKKRGK